MSKRQGFTLVELSIVIVIIGLIIAGVTAGRAVVQEARIRAQISDFNKFEAAFNAFRVQYNTVPGDLSNASSYWTGATDGDGNKRITDTADRAGYINEDIRFFEHLYRAGLIPESYTNTWAIGVGYPALKLNSNKGMIAGGSLDGSNVGSIYQLSTSELRIQHVASLYLNVCTPSAILSGYNDASGAGSPITMSAIDRKIDDGIARTGKFKSYRGGSSTNCLTGTDGDYLTNVTTEACAAEYILAK